jgi:8-oxo-dGTP diphosphatase
MAPEIPEIYRNRTRVRTCGLCWDGQRLLMVNHQGLTGRNFWAPPGGGIEFGEAAPDALVREFLEETNVHIRVGELRFVCEYIQPPLHSVELFFAVDSLEGEPRKGMDPESTGSTQLITDVQFMTLDQIFSLPEPERHGIFKVVATIADLKKLSGFHRI